MKLSAHFSVEEFTASETAARRGIDNDLPLALVETAKRTCDMMELIRGHLCILAGKDVPIQITSGYRSPELNRAIGSKPTSDHTAAMAVDFKAPSFGTPLQVAAALVPEVDKLGIGQLICEFPPSGWVHVSLRRPDKTMNRIITITAQGTVPGVQGA